MLNTLIAKRQSSGAEEEGKRGAQGGARKALPKAMQGLNEPVLRGKQPIHVEWVALRDDTAHPRPHCTCQDYHTVLFSLLSLFSKLVFFFFYTVSD